jgi:ribosomal protein S18 acetylase RimI-like enzyme
LAYLKFNFKEKWEFTYFEISLEVEPYLLPPKINSLIFRIATPEDITKIQTDIYPLLTKNQENDKRYILKIGENGIICFIAELNKKVVHYFLVFVKVHESPLMKTPFEKSKLLENDAYLGSAFTAPEVRGFWIMPNILLYILSYLRENTNASRALLLVHKNTPGAVGFYLRLGFSIIQNPERYNLFYFIAKGLNYFQKK